MTTLPFRFVPLATAILLGAAACGSAETSAAPPAVTSASAASGAECRAKSGAVELNLSWTNDTATGTLVVDGKSQPVVAQLYKGLVLVDVAGKKEITGDLATVTTEGTKTIRLGDFKQPTFDCK